MTGPRTKKQKYRQTQRQKRIQRIVDELKGPPILTADDIRRMLKDAVDTVDMSYLNKLRR